MRKLVVYIILIVVCALVAAQERFDLKVRNYFFSGFTGDSAALEKGMKMCEDELATHPRNAQAMVWHGTGIYFQAISFFQKGDSQNGMQLAQRGMKEMDEAVALAPDDLGVRIPRGAFLLTVGRNMPSAMARPMIERGVADLEKAYSVQYDSLDKLGTHPKGELLLGLADGYTRLGQTEKAQPIIDRIRTEMKGTRYEASAILWGQNNSLPPDKAGCLGCHMGN